MAEPQVVTTRHGPESGKAPRRPRPEFLVMSVTIGGIATLVALPMSALNAFGWGFMVGDWRFFATAFEVLASVALIPFTVAHLASRSKWVASTATWLAVSSLVVSVPCWTAGVYNAGQFWHALDTLGTVGVLIGAATQRVLDE